MYPAILNEKIGFLGLLMIWSVRRVSVVDRSDKELTGTTVTKVLFFPVATDNPLYTYDTKKHEQYRMPQIKRIVIWRVNESDFRIISEGK